ncbi:MAG: 50S ribosomal protein L10 [Candidatus Marinimicrobia bacterium]|nr:50S ribosomal protein L10 [Candidatus Neomarinimicrobiota bacterium]
MPTPRKEAIVEDIARRMRTAAAVYFADYTGLSAPQATELRARLREVNVEYTVVKKTLSRLAAQGAGLGDIDAFLQGQTVLAFSYDDPVSLARIFRDFGQENDSRPVVTGIIMDGQQMPASAIGELAALPPKEILIAQLLSALQYPVAQLAATLSGAMSKLVMTLTSLKEQKTS